jgi:hypothetical protein
MILTFKKWLESSMLDQKASQTFVKQNWDQNAILYALGLQPTKLNKVNTGSFATVYQYPNDPHKVIKVTSDKADAHRLINAQKLNSPNIVKIYKSAQLPNGSMILVSDFINGASMPYTSNTISALITGKNMMDSAINASRKILQPGTSPFRDRILQKFGHDNAHERQKLSELFMTLARLERMGIDINDFTDNVIDNGQHYVIIDMGL